MINLRFDKNKKTNKFNIKVIAIGIVAITLIGIVGISIGRSYTPNSKISSVIMDGVTIVEQNLNAGFSFFKSGFEDILNYRKNSQKVSTLEKENQKLKEEVIKLNSELDKRESLESLKKSLNFIGEDYKYETISTEVVAKNDGNWYSSIVIGAGKNQGVKKDSIVINGDGLVGMVYEVSDNYSKAISILDSKSSVSFKLLKEASFKGLITQNTTLENKDTYKNEGYVYGYMFDNLYEVLPGDVVVTSGLGIYPEGIPIGEIDKVIEDKNKSMKHVVVKPYANFKNIDDVIVIEPRNIG